jgi:hypothetical protein
MLVRFGMEEVEAVVPGRPGPRSVRKIGEGFVNGREGALPEPRDA